jgi:hypothetical protein
MTDHLTSPEYTNPDLADRMAAYTEGQATWPDLRTSHRCGQCGFFDRPSKSKPEGKCQKRSQINARLRQGKAFSPDAIACPLFAKAEGK